MRKGSTILTIILLVWLVATIGICGLTVLFVLENIELQESLLMEQVESAMLERELGVKVREEKELKNGYTEWKLQVWLPNGATLFMDISFQTDALSRMSDWERGKLKHAIRVAAEKAAKENWSDPNEILENTTERNSE